MAKDQSKTSSKTASKSGTKTSSKSGGAAKRSTVRVSSKSIRQQLADLISSPNLFWGTIVLIGFVLVVGSITNWTRGQLLVSVGQVMEETRTSRVEFNTEDVQQTQMHQQAARLNVARIHNADLPVLEELRASLANLPRTLGGVATLDEVDRDIRVRFGLSEESFATLRETASQDATRSCEDARFWIDRPGSARPRKGSTPRSSSALEHQKNTSSRQHASAARTRSIWTTPINANRKSNG